MAGWEKYIGKKVYVETKTGRHPYQGKVIEIDSSSEDVTFIVMIDKFGRRVTFAHTEINVLKEEE